MPGISHCNAWLPESICKCLVEISVWDFRLRFQVHISWTQWVPGILAENAKDAAVSKKSRCFFKLFIGLKWVVQTIANHVLWWLNSPNSIPWYMYIWEHTTYIIDVSICLIDVNNPKWPQLLSFSEHQVCYSIQLDFPFNEIVLNHSWRGSVLFSVFLVYSILQI